MDEIFQKIKSQSRLRILIGMFFVVFGFSIHMIPFVPGSWAIAIGLEILGIRLLVQDKLKKMPRVYALGFAVFGLLITLIGALYFIKITKTGNNAGAPQLSVYKNSEYGFEITYPSNLTATTTFKNYYHLGSNWRSDAALNSDGQAAGQPIVSIPVYRIDNNSGAYVSYPLYYAAELRIGVSSDPNDVKACLLPTNETLSQPEIINGINFSKFIIENAGMMQYLEGVSYRTIHNGICYAVEQLKTGSSYRDVPNAKDIPDSVLNSYYNQIPDIIKTFKFTPETASADYKNAVYFMDGRQITPASQGMKYFGNEVRGDLNNDGIGDIAFLFTYDGGGSGTFYYVVAALGSKDGYIGTNAIFLGDRIAPQATEFRDGNIIVNYADRKPTDPMTARPSVGVSKYLKIDNGNLVEITR
jgi:hypothetical protein